MVTTSVLSLDVGLTPRWRLGTIEEGFREEQASVMSRSTKSIKISFSEETCNRLDQVCSSQGKSRNEFAREAVEHYLMECVWEELFRYGHQQARELGIKPEDVERLVEEYRTEVRADQE